MSELYKTNRGKFSNGVKKHGMTLVEVMITIIIVGLLALIAIPAFTTATARVRRDTCINNLRQINLAKEQWALENNIEEGDAGSTPTVADLDPYIREDLAGDPSSLCCPLDSDEDINTSYTINAFGNDPICNIAGDAQGGDHEL